MADAEEKTRQKFIARMGAILCSCRHRIVVPGEYSSLDFPRVRDRTVNTSPHGKETAVFGPFGKGILRILWPRPTGLISPSERIKPPTPIFTIAVRAVP